jgi:uncharacterized membrane protein YheB (UPF0754 family)
MSAFIGWVTNVLAVRMIFRPYRRVKIIGPIGWQSILVRQAHRFARDVADMVTQEFFTPRDLAARVDPGRVRRALDGHLRATVGKALARVLDDLPPAVRGSALVGPAFLDVVERQLLDEADGLVREAHALVVERIDGLVDLHAEIVSNLTGGEVARLERLILGVVGKEFRWIEYYGGIFGAAFGVVALGLQAAGLTSPWLLPVMGVAIGLLTNWIAILMLFSPRHPVRIGPWTLQGVFPGRQAEIALALAATVEREMLGFGAMLDLALERGLAAELRRHLVARFDRLLATRLQVPLTILAAAGAEVSAEQIAETVLADMAPELTSALATVKAAAESDIRMAALVHTKLDAMDTLRFEQILRGLVRQDEPMLIAYGGLLGGLLGLVQMALAKSLA